MGAVVPFAAMIASFKISAVNLSPFTAMIFKPASHSEWAADEELRDVEHLRPPVTARDRGHHLEAGQHQLRPPGIPAFFIGGMSCAGP